MVKKDPRLERAGVSGFNKPKRTPDHPKKSHIVVAKEGETIKTIRFGEQGASTAGAPKAGESEAMFPGRGHRASNMTNYITLNVPAPKSGNPQVWGETLADHFAAVSASNLSRGAA